jgi:hypothetical protein
MTAEPIIATMGSAHAAEVIDVYPLGTSESPQTPPRLSGGYDVHDIRRPRVR